MVSSDLRSGRRGTSVDWEEPLSFDGLHTYQLIIKSRSLSYIASKQGAFRNCKITRLRLDGSTEYMKDSKSYRLPGINFLYHKNKMEHIRFDGSVIGKDIDLLEVLNEIKSLNPSTIYILEMDIKTDSGMVIKFASKQMKMGVVLDRIDRSKDTFDSPLVLRHIYDIETLRDIRKTHVGKKISFILEGKKGTKETTLYDVVE